VVVVPGEGILCLEVKSGPVSRRDGLWFFGKSSTSSSPRSPFRQAAEGMHALRAECARRNPSLGRLLFFSAVVFTDIEFDEISPEWHSWQVVDRLLLSREPVSRIFPRVLENAHAHLRESPSATWYHPDRSRPGEPDIRALEHVLRGNFEYPVMPHHQAAVTEREILDFTTEQFRALDLMEENERILFKGPAGTGKTFLALEASRRSVYRGHRTLLTCFNTLLSGWLLDQWADRPDTTDHPLHVSTFHSLLLEIAGLDPPGKPGPSYWSHTLPELALETLLEDRSPVTPFELLIVDEAQDLITDLYLDILDLLLEGGLSGGRWLMFGDFENQAIYSGGETAQQLESRISARTTSLVRYPLRINCRNTTPIARLLEIACGLDPGYSRVLHLEDTPHVSTFFWSSRSHAEDLLERRLLDLSSVFRPEDIVVLSAREDSSSLAGSLASGEANVPLVPLREATRGRKRIRYSTIHAFKGLEARAVVLTDLDPARGGKFEELLYVGMSRARLDLTILLPEDSREAWSNLIVRGTDRLIERT